MFLNEQKSGYLAELAYYHANNPHISTSRVLSVSHEGFRRGEFWVVDAKNPVKSLSMTQYLYDYSTARNYLLHRRMGDLHYITHTSLVKVGGCHRPTELAMIIALMGRGGVEFHATVINFIDDMVYVGGRIVLDFNEYEDFLGSLWGAHLWDIREEDKRSVIPSKRDILNSFLEKEPGPKEPPIRLADLFKDKGDKHLGAKRLHPIAMKYPTDQ